MSSALQIVRLVFALTLRLYHQVGKLCPRFGPSSKVMPSDLVKLFPQELNQCRRVHSLWPHLTDMIHSAHPAVTAQQQAQALTCWEVHSHLFLQAVEVCKTHQHSRRNCSNSRHRSSRRHNSSLSSSSWAVLRCRVCRQAVLRLMCRSCRLRLTLLKGH